MAKNRKAKKKRNTLRENAAQGLFEAIKYYIENTPDNGE